MKKTGFTLVELLAVIVLIAIITTIGTVGINAVSKNINQNLWEGTISLIENGAIDYGEDNKNRLKNMCVIGTEVKEACLIVTVDFLINNGYIKTKEVDDEGNKVLINNTLDKSDSGYYVNNLNVYIYQENDIVYAKLMT